jgi:lysophospholipase L1-like esterase
VSADGSAIVGYAGDPPRRAATIYDSLHGTRLLSTVLADFGLDLGDWQLVEATGISADGQQIVGKGINPAGRSEAWLVNLGDQVQPPILRRPSTSCDTFPPPAAPAVELSWTSVEGATSYDLYRDSVRYASGLTGTSFQNEANVVAGQTYTYVVEARVSGGNLRSAPLTVDVPADACPSSPPIVTLDQPEARCESDRPVVELSWSASTGTYDLYRNGFPYASGLTGTSYKNEANVVAGQTYTYFVRAGSATGLSNSLPRSIPIDPNICAAPPAKFKLDQPRVVCDKTGQGHYQVLLSWDAAPGAESYDVYRDDVIVAPDLPSNPNLRSEQHLDRVTNGKTYKYRVTATNQAAEHTQSNEATILVSSPSCPRINYVALGDSISAGEGGHAYFAGRIETDPTHRYTTYNSFPCHRSSVAFASMVQPTVSPSPVLVTQDRQEGTPLLACSGATAVNVWAQSEGGKAQTDKSDKNGDSSSWPYTFVTAIQQLDRIYDGRFVVNPDVDLITITIGANDLGFFDVAKACLLYDCVRRPVFDNQTKTLSEYASTSTPVVRPRLVATFAEIRRLARNATILVVGYGQAVAATGAAGEAGKCPSVDPQDRVHDMYLDPAERLAMRSAADKLNDAIESAAEEAGVFFVPVSPSPASTAKALAANRPSVDYVAGHELCGTMAPEWFNPVYQTMTANLFVGTDPEQFHPNPAGYQAYARAVNHFLGYETRSPRNGLKLNGLPRNPDPSSAGATMARAAANELTTPESLGPLAIAPSRPLVCPVPAGVVLRGQLLRVHGDGFAPRSLVSITLTSSDSSAAGGLGSAEADDAGAIDTQVIVPTDLPIGEAFMLEAIGTEEAGAGRRLVELVQSIGDLERDSDGDTIPDVCDTCPDTPGELQADSDEDGAGDQCDTCLNDPDNDLDGDLVCGDVDNCPTVANPSQVDADSDGVGNACDGDLNGDGTVDTRDTAILEACLGRAAGPGIGPPDDPNCAESDLDSDESVTTSDRRSMNELLLIPEPNSLGLGLAAVAALAALRWSCHKQCYRPKIPLVPPMLMLGSMRRTSIRTEA